jgi:LmbE family N-acetylglucosaminyl deacetylase
MLRMAAIVAFHAHPDDEVLLTGGTLARLAAEGHRTVVVVACDGLMGEATGEGSTARLDELRASARILGVARVVHLGYADSGHGPVLFPDPADRVRFVRAPVEEAARRLADILRHESADVLISYDAQGGYGHRDHVRVHEVGALAALLAETPRVLQATAPREPLVRIFRALRAIGLLRRYGQEEIRSAYTPRAAITHRVDVRRFAGAKRAALACHLSQVRGRGRASLPMRILVSLPTPLFALLLGREWFVEPDADQGRGVWLR